MMSPISLYDLHRQLRRVIALNFDEALYISAEIVKINSSRGHWYIELAEKDEKGQQLKAKSTAIIWRNVYQALSKEYGTLLDDVLKPGVEIAFRAEVQYHEVYGLKLHIQTVDPTFTLGKESQRRIQIIQKLKEKDLLDANAKRHLPGIIQNIAVISSETAAGYADFLETLGNSPFKIAYRTTLFQASMQGNNTESDVCSQLEIIQEISAKYDLIVIIRGGGGRMDLRYFDNLPIAIRIAESDLPVWTGIGHATDQTVVDLVAHTSCKTPTAVAQQIDEFNRQFLYRLEAAKTTITELARVRLMDGYSELNQIRQELSFISKSAFDKKYNELHRYEEKLGGLVKTKLEKFFIDIHQKKQRLRDLHPSRILERGYVALEQGEKRIYRISDFTAEEVMKLTFSDGTLSVKPKNVSQ